MRINKEWTRWDPEIDQRDLPGAMGIFEIADDDHETLYIGRAGGDSPFGLRGELFRIFASAEAFTGRNWTHPRLNDIPAELKSAARFYRYEVNHQYYSRWIEALSRYREDHEELPPLNRNDKYMPPLGRYHWKSVEA